MRSSPPTAPRLMRRPWPVFNGGSCATWKDGPPRLSPAWSARCSSVPTRTGSTFTWGIATRGRVASRRRSSTTAWPSRCARALRGPSTTALSSGASRANGGWLLPMSSVPSKRPMRLVSSFRRRGSNRVLFVSFSATSPWRGSIIKGPAAAGAGRSYARAARVNLAKLDLNAGLAERARAALDAIHAEQPGDPNERFGIAVLALRLGVHTLAEAELTRLLLEASGDAAEIHAFRAVARLAQGRTSEAVDDASAALKLRPSPGHERLWFRTLLADGRDSDLPELLALDDPDEVERLQTVGLPLVNDLRAAATRLRMLCDRGGVIAVPARRTRAVLLAALRDRDANAEATRAVAENPESPDGYLVRARIRRRTGDPPGALADVGRGLALVPADPRFWELRGCLLVELGQPEAALSDLQRAALKGARGTVHAARACALMDLGHFEAARDAWTAALGFDSEDPRAYLGRARVQLRLGRWDDGSADLEQAVGWSRSQPTLLARITLTYAGCIPRRPDKLMRVMELARQTLVAWLGNSRRPRTEQAVSE